MELMPDLTAAHRIAARLEAGQVQINRYPAGDVTTPFGGYKHSGIGREKGAEAMLHYSQLKTVIVDLPDKEASYHLRSVSTISHSTTLYLSLRLALTNSL